MVLGGHPTNLENSNAKADRSGGSCRFVHTISVV